MTGLRTMLMSMRSVFGPRVFVVVLFIGGSKTELIKYYGGRPRHALFAMDNATDLEKVKELTKELGVTTIPLGRAQSAESLAQRLGKSYQEAVRRFAPTDAKSGFGAAPLIGYMSALVMFTAFWFKTLLTRLLCTIRAATNNAPDLVLVRVVGSVAGGTCTGYFRPSIDAFVSTLARLGVHVQVEMDFVGANAFAHIDDRVHQVAAAVTPYVVACTMDTGPAGQELVTKHATISELPPELSEPVRKQLVLVEEAAVTSSEMVKLLHRIRPNHGTSSIYGNVTLRESDFFHGLDLHEKILPQVAATLLEELQNATSQIVSDASLVSKIDFEERVTKSSSVKRVEEICESLFERPAAELLVALVKPQLAHKSSLLVEMVTGERFSGSALPGMFVSPVAALSDAIERSVLIHTLIQRLSDERRALKQMLDQVADDIEAASKEFQALLAHLVRPSEEEEFDGDKLFTKLVRAGFKIRKLADEKALYGARSSAIRECSDDLEQSLAIAEAEFNALADTLKEFKREGMGATRCKYVEVMPLEKCFPALATIAQKPKLVATETLRWCATRVTIEGLAHIVNAPLPTVNAIADQVVFGTPPHESSPYGGLACDDVPKTYYALPPIAEFIERELRSAIEQRDSHSEVVFTDTIGVGANVLRIRLRFPKSIEEIMHGSHRRELQEVLCSPIRDNFFPGDTAYLERAGVFIENDTFTLKSQETLQAQTVKGDN